MKEENKLIAEFMGLVNSYSDKDYTKWMKYNSSWDWLMPVVEQIEHLNYFVDINHWTSIYKAEWETRDCIVTVIDGTKFKNTYKAVVEFIKWYNENKKQ